MNVESVRRDAYDAEHQSVLVALADMAVAVLKKAEDERKTRRAMQVAMLGEMGANAQHDLNRQVGYIRRQVFLLRDKLKAIKAEPDLRNKIERGLVTIDKDASLLKKTHFPTVNIDVLQIPIPVHLVVENQLELLQANEPDVVFEYVPAHHHAQVRVAEVTLEMIINHLLQNAVRAASRGRNEQPKVSIRTWLPEPGQIVIEIADNGPGVREDFVEKLFYEPIRQIEGGIERISTGLMLVGMFAEAYGGKAWLKENQLGKGASFGLQFSTIDKTGHGIEGEI